jgi:D-hexose-6-phosphate mutarotase
MIIIAVRCYTADFRCEFIHDVSVVGMQGVSYADKTRGGDVFIDDEASIIFNGEVDRAYHAVPGSVAIQEKLPSSSSSSSSSKPKLDLRLSRSATLPDVVVWNPWQATNDKMGVS